MKPASKASFGTLSSKIRPVATLSSGAALGLLSLIAILLAVRYRALQQANRLQAKVEDSKTQDDMPVENIEDKPPSHSISKETCISSVTTMEDIAGEKQIIIENDKNSQEHSIKMVNQISFFNTSYKNEDCQTPICSKQLVGDFIDRTQENGPREVHDLGKLIYYTFIG